MASDSNDIFNALGVPSPVDPLGVAGPASIDVQSAMRERFEEVLAIRSTHYETFPLYGEMFLISVLQTAFEDDTIFTYVPEKPEDSRIIITNSFNRSQTMRDKMPRLVVKFQGAQATTLALRDTFQAHGPQQPMDEKRGLLETSVFKVTALHPNPTLAQFIAQQARGEIILNMQLMRELFRLYQVLPPSITGTGPSDELPDMFEASITLQVVAIPKWTQRQSAKRINRIILSVRDNANRILEEALLAQDQTLPTQ